MKNLLKITLILSLFVSVSLSNTLDYTTNSIVKVFSSLSIPNYKQPWQTGSRSQISGSGVIIQNNYIITNAHVVSNAKFIQVTKDKSTKKYIAKIKYISHQADLALLEVEDKSFFKDTVALKFTEDVQKGDNITVLGYPIGGDTLSTTKGTTSRIESTSYAWSYQRMLAIQVDASINSGNSGGAALNDKNEIVGIVMQSYQKDKSDNIGYVIPSLIVNTFLEDIKDGKVDGFDDSQTFYQTFKNEALKNYYQMKNDNGVLIRQIEDSETVLKLGDIILEIDGKSIANDGTIQTKYGTQYIPYLFHTKPVGRKLKIKLLRDGNVINTEYTLKRKQELVKLEYNQEPRYIIFGGCSFTPLTKNYLKTHNMNSVLFNVYYEQNKETKHVKEPVTIQFEKFNHNINEAYYPFIWLVKSVNKVKVVDFNHFAKLLVENKEQYTVIEFWDTNTKVVFDTKKARDSFEEIKNIYGLSVDRRIK